MLLTLEWCIINDMAHKNPGVHEPFLFATGQAAACFIYIYSGHSDSFEEFNEFKLLIRKLGTRAEIHCFFEAVMMTAYMLIYTCRRGFDV